MSEQNGERPECPLECLVGRLREACSGYSCSVNVTFVPIADVLAAADEIERLQFERDAFKAASDARARILEDVALTGEMTPNTELSRVAVSEESK